MAAHAILSASSASRWIGCSGSVALIAQLPSRYTNQTSVYADEGSAAHTVGERCLRHGEILPEDFRGQLIEEELQGWIVNDDMIEASTVYVEYVRRRQREMGANLFIEVSVRPLLEFDDMWGTADAILVEPYGEIEVIDYKHGAGVYVDEADNDQMKFYGLGALMNVGPMNVSGATTTIVQPRIGGAKPVRPWSLSVDKLVDFGDTMRAARIAAEKPDAPLTPGDHCRWCPAAALCPALNEQAKAVVKVDFKDEIAAAAEGPPEPEITVTLPDPDDPNALYLGLLMVKPLEHFTKRVKEMALENMERGIPVRGHKLVRKRAYRRWIDEADLERRLKNRAGIKKSDTHKTALKSPAQLEKVGQLGKEWVAKHCETPQGGLTLAPTDDPRPAYRLIEEFADVLGDSNKD